MKTEMRTDSREPLMMYQVYANMLKEYGKGGITFINEKGERQRLTYMEIGWLAVIRMERLKECGVKPHDFLMFQMYNDMDFVINFWACMFGGFVPVLTNPVIGFQKGSQEAEVFTYIFHHLDEPKVVVSVEAEEEYRQFAEEIGIDEGKFIFTRREDREIPDKENPVPENNFLSPDDPCMMFFTSGTTGMPKCVLQTNRAAVMRERAVAEKNHFHKDVTLNWMPLEHAGGILMAHFRAVLQGGEQIQVEKGYILEDPVRWLDLLDEFCVSYSWAPHFAYVLINKAIEAGRTGNWDLSCVTFLLDGGEMVDAASGAEFLRLLSRWKLHSDVLHPSWGMCETCSGVLYNNCFDLEKQCGVQLYEGRILTEIGEPVPGMDVRIVDEKNEELADGEIGVFQIRGIPVTLGYYRNEEANKEAFTEDGWFNTGDKGFKKNNSITLTGREKDVVVIHGMNFSNAEIESVIDTLEIVRHSFVAVCQCMAPDGTEEVVAFFTPIAHIEPVYAADMVMRHVQKKIHIELTRAIPVAEEEIAKSNLGKIQRSKISKKYTAGYFETLKAALEEKRAFMAQTEVPDWIYKECFVETGLQQNDRDKKAVCLLAEQESLKVGLKDGLTISEKSEVIVYQGSFESLRSLGRKIASNGISCKTLYVLTERMYRMKGDVSSACFDGEMAGYLRCLEAECENLACVNIDMESFEDPESQRLAIEEIQAEEVCPFTVLIRKGKRMELKLEQVAVPDNGIGFTWNGLYLITGGLGGIASELCRYLLKYYQARVVLTGRRRLADSEEAAERFQGLREISEDVFYESIDVGDTVQMEQVIGHYEKKYRCTLKEIIHTAGLGNLQEHWKEWETRLIKNCPDAIYQEMLHPKKDGTMSLYQLAQSREDVRLLLFGSTNGFFGTASFSAYSAANSYLSIFALNKQDAKTHIRSMNFSTWKETGMSLGNDFGHVGVNKGFWEIGVKEGILSVEQNLRAEEPSVYIGLNGQKEYLKKYLCQTVTVEKEKSRMTTHQFDAMELKLAEIWEEILHTPVTDMTDDFFELGGNSIKAFSLPKAITEQFQVDYSLKDVFRYSRFDEMKASIQERKK